MAGLGTSASRSWSGNAGVLVSVLSKTRETKENVASEHGRDVSCILRVLDARRDALLRV